MHSCCIIGLNMSLNTIKTTDVPLMKTLKATPSSIKLAFGAMCVILGIGPEKIPEAQSKKNVIIHKKRNFSATEHVIEIIMIIISNTIYYHCIILKKKICNFNFTKQHLKNIQV